MDAIFNRRSMRRYTGEPIPEEMITKLLKAGMRAPSADNEQPWEFIVIKDRQTMLRITEFHAYASMLKYADCAIVVCGDTQKQLSPFDYWVQDCSAATQNILLEAFYLGIGAVWLGVYPDDKRVDGLRQLLEIPSHVIPLNIISLGRPGKETSPLDTFRPERIHREKW